MTQSERQERSERVRLNQARLGKLDTEERMFAYFSLALIAHGRLNISGFVKADCERRVFSVLPIVTTPGLGHVDTLLENTPSKSPRTTPLPSSKWISPGRKGAG